MQNPNWPLIDEAVSFPTDPTTGNPTIQYWVSLGPERSTGTFTTERGRVYEFDQVDTGEANTTWRNKDGALDPENASSPFYPMVVPYRGFRRRAQYPATINLLTAAQATAGAQPNDDLTAVATGGMPENSLGSSLYPTSVSAAHVYSSALPANPVSGNFLVAHYGWSVPGPHADGSAADTITAQCQVTATVSTSLILHIGWVDVNGVLLSQTIGTPATVTSAHVLTVTGTPPAGCAGAYIALYLNSSPTSACTVTSVFYQVERNSSASSYVQPNRWAPIYNGYVERFPQTWIQSGLYGMSAVKCVDAFGWMSQQTLYSPAYMEVLATSSSSLQYLFCLDEDDTAAQFQDATGQTAPIQFANRGPGVSGFTAKAGADITSLNGTPPYGIGGPVAEIDQPATGAGSIVLNLGGRADTMPPTTSGWTRLFACNPSATTAGATVVVWDLVSGLTLSDTANTGTTVLTVAASPATSGYATLAITINSVVVVSNFYAGTNVITDGQWHVLAVTMSADGKTVMLYVDGVLAVNYTNATDMRFSALGWVDVLGTSAPSNSIQYSLLAQWTTPLAGSAIATISTTFLQGGSVNAAGATTSATRWADILRWLGYAGMQSADAFTTGECNAYGPPTELYATRSQDGTDGVDALQTVVDTEGGADYVSLFGAVTLKSRRARYNQTTPAITFGEDPTRTGAEIPYDTIEFGLDTSRVVTDAQFTQTSTSAVTRYLDSTAAKQVGDIAIQRDINTLNAYEVSDAAQYTVNHGKSPQRRLETLRVPVGTNPTAAVWLAMLGLELGTFAQVNRRPLAPAAMIELIGFVEQANWTMTDGVDAWVDLQISPQFAQTFWYVGSTRTTLHTSVSASATSAVINALPNSATNPVQCDISSAADPFGWVIDWGTASAEYVTITAPTPNTAGYSTAAIGIGTCMRADTGATGTGFQFAHSAGVVIQDIGGAEASGMALALLNSYISPANALDQFCLVGTDTIVGY